MKRKLVTLFLAGALLATHLTGCTIGNTEIVLDMNNVGRNHVFSINGTKCTKEEARLYLCNYQNIYGSVYGLNLWEYDFSEADTSLEAYVKDVTLYELANVMCMQLLAEEQGIELNDAELELVADAADEYYESLSKEEISYISLDKNELREFYERYAIAQKLYNTLTQGINEEVSDDEARVIRIQQIYVTDDTRANEVKQKLENGSDFASVASSYNEADVIETNVSRDTYPEEVEDVIFNLDDNEQSGMIRTEEGYYFFKCLNKYDKELTEANKENIVVKRRKEQFDDKFMEFIENSQFELNEKVWENIKVDTSGDITTNSFFEIYEKHFTSAS